MTPTHDNLGVRGVDVSGETKTIAGTVESVSTRVLVDGSERECGACDATIATGTRYRCLTVRSNDGEISELSFCGRDCVESVRES